jgi:hypothetical protein
MNIVKYQKNTVVKIDVNGMVYLNGDGYEKYIDFMECRKNWLDYVKESGEFPESNLRNLEDSVCVAWRDVMGKPAYIEFFTSPRTRFIFTSRRSILDILLFRKSQAWVKDFHEVQLLIGRIGWSTFDLS